MGWTPLITAAGTPLSENNLAIENNRVPMAELLLNEGASIDAADDVSFHAFRVFDH
jgi:hypothetical protein